MRPIRSLLILLAALLLAAPSAGAAPAPMMQLKAQNDRLDKLLKQRRSGADNAASKAEMRSIVNGLLDYDELARRSLASHWNEITPAQQAEFVKLLRELIEKNYLKQLRTNLDYEVLYKSENIREADAIVSTIVKVRTKGKSTDTPIDYKMKKVGDRWLVYDIITDEVSMVQNYRQQFNKIINNERFEGLMRKMRNKVEEGENGDPGKVGDAAPAAPATQVATPARPKLGAKPARKR